MSVEGMFTIMYTYNAYNEVLHSKLYHIEKVGYAKKTCNFILFEEEKKQENLTEQNNKQLHIK